MPDRSSSRQTRSQGSDTGTPDTGQASEAAADGPKPFSLQAYSADRPRRDLRRLPRLAGTAVSIARAAAPREFATSAGLQLFSGAAVGIQLVVLRSLLAGLLDDGTVEAQFGSLVPELAALAVLSALVGFVGVARGEQQRLLGELVAVHTSEQLIAAAGAVDLVTFDDPTFHDRLQRAQLSAGSRPIQLASGLLGVASAAFAIAGIAGALLLIQPALLGFVLIAYVPAWLATNRASRVIYEYSVDQTERERRKQYLFAIQVRRIEAQEIRAFGLSGFLAGRFHDLAHRQIADLRTAVRRRLKISLVGQFLSAALTSLAVGVLVWFVTQGRLDVADAAAAAAALVLLGTRLRTLASSAGQIYESSLYLEDYTGFVADLPTLTAAHGDIVAPHAPRALEVDGVSFRYPSRQTASINDASIRLGRGEVVALVGENGSGKTTLAKLLSGLYEPSAGRVTLDGIDVGTLTPESRRALFAVIFQDFTRYHLTAHENIALGDPLRFDRRDEVIEAAKAAGAHEAIESLPDGYDTLLGPEFYGGSDLSLGQWQRLALARALFRRCPFIVLDEPTAALDARAEAALYAGMRSVFDEQGVLLISHRFGSTRTADRIYVVRDGRVVETGTHADLVAAQGYYAELYELQAGQYRD